MQLYAYSEQRCAQHIDNIFETFHISCNAYSSRLQIDGQVDSDLRLLALQQLYGPVLTTSGSAVIDAYYDPCVEIKTVYQLISVCVKLKLVEMQQFLCTFLWV